MTLKILNINIKQNQIFNKFAKIYFKELNNNFKATKNWKKNRLKELLKKKTNFVKWITKDKNKIGFFILLKQKNKYTKEKKILIHDIFILKKYRKKNIGNEVVRKILIFSKKQKINVIEIEILLKNKKVYKFWKKFNFKPVSNKFFLKL